MKLRATHTFAIGVTIALVVIAALSLLKEKPATVGNTSPNTTSQTASTQPDSTSIFQSLFSSQPPANPTRGQPTKAEFVPPAQNKNSSEVKPIEFTSPDDMDAVVAKYPFLKENADAVKLERASPDIFALPISMDYAELNDRKAKARLLVVLMGGSSACGSGGCYGAIYADTGGGYPAIPYAFLAASDVFYREDKNNGLSIFNCGRRGLQEFRLQQGKIAMIKPPSVNPAQVPGCTH